MNNLEFIDFMNTHNYVEADSFVHKKFHEMSQRAIKLTMEINTKYHTEAELVDLFSKLTCKQISPDFRIFPPFYTDCGINISLGKNVFINACCKFQDQGGIEIGDNVFIGHSVVIATINHNFKPKKRVSMIAKKVKIGNNVWVGSNVTILPGVTICDGAIIGAGSVVTKNIPSNTIAAGNPAKVIKEIGEE